MYADVLAAWIHAEEPEPVHQPMSLLDAVAASTQAAQEHAEQCDTCDRSMRLAEMCLQGQRAVLAALTPRCAHVAWEVTWLGERSGRSDTPVIRFREKSTSPAPPRPV
ncbi:hypothetical protein [Streptomyces sp. NPDC093149]|uniref:hypothetical protein n=1 Tax=Streptomyces sp. NPDC093149 TaxID=3366031 RepID=UPI0037F86D48